MQGTIQLNGSVATIILEPKKFSTGSTGYYGNGKLATSDGKYQISITAVKIGSKPEKN